MDWSRLDETEKKTPPEVGVSRVKVGDLNFLPKSRKFEVVDFMKAYQIAILGSTAFIDKNFKTELETALKEQKVEIKDWSPILKTYHGLVKSILDVTFGTTFTLLELDENVRLHVCYEPVEKEKEKKKTLFTKPKPKEKKMTKAKKKK